ncbi:cytochrome P450 [Pseudonocardia sp. CA-107938]|uniref:cytochrome P450 n=1 Tax=Pseudonocardia sp. CA-107938 TaxID=3240021 RepID=UPI003D936753
MTETVVAEPGHPDDSPHRLQRPTSWYGRRRARNLHPLAERCMLMTASTSKCPVHESYNPFVAPQLDDPFGIWAEARHERPVFYSSLLDAYVITRYSDIVSVLKQPRVYGSVASRKMFGKACPEADRILAELPAMEETNPLSSDAPVHTKIRRYLQAAFLPRRVAVLEPTLTATADEVIDTFVERGRGDFYSDFAFRYPLLVVGRLVGIPDSDLDKVKDWAGQRVDLRNSDLDEQTQIAAAKAQREYYEYTLQLVADRRAQPGQDLLSWIIQDSDASDDPLTEDQLASQATSLLTAGHETTAHWLVVAVRRLLQERGRWDALVADPASLSMKAVEEGLRVDGPVQAIWRKVKQDVEIGGVSIPAGARLSLVLGSANDDETVFPDPRTFDDSRANVTQHLTFGRGPHTCVGAPIARLEARIALMALARRLPRLRLAADDELMFKPNATQRMAQRLLVEWD